MKRQAPAQRPPPWGLVAAVAALVAACASDPECSGPAGLCLELPGEKTLGGGGSDAPQGGAPSEAGAPSTSAGEAGTGGKGGKGGGGSGGRSLPAVGGTTSAGGGAVGGTTTTGGTASVGFGGAATSPGGGPQNPQPSDCTVLPPLPLWLSDLTEPRFSRHYNPNEPAYAVGPDEIVPCQGPAGTSGECYGFEWALGASSDGAAVWAPEKSCKDPLPSAITFRARGGYGGEVIWVSAFGGKPEQHELTTEWRAFSLNMPSPSWSGEAELPAIFEVRVVSGLAPVKTLIYLSDLHWISFDHCMPPKALPATCSAADARNGGAGGAGADACGAAAGAPSVGGDLLLLDDFEDGDGQSLALPQGHGRWATYNDATPGSYQFPEPCPLPSTVPSSSGQNALLTFGCGFNRWGAGVQLLMDEADECGQRLDAEGYDGIQFRAQGTARRLIVQVDTDATAPSLCVEKGEAVGCSAFEREVFLEGAEAWGIHRVAFSELKRDGKVFSASAPIRSINFTYRPAARNVGYSFAIDDVMLYRDDGTAAP